MSTRINIGKKPKSANTDKLLWTIPSNTTITAKILVDNDHIIEGHFCQHNGKIWAYSGDDDPCHGIEGVEPRFSVLVPCTVKIGTSKEYKVIRGPQTISKQLEALAVKGDLRGLLVNIKREDGRFAKYTITPTGQRATVEEDQDELVNELLSNIKQGTSEEIAEWLGVSKTIEEEQL